MQPELERLKEMLKSHSWEEWAGVPYEVACPVRWAKALCEWGEICGLAESLGDAGKDILDSYVQSKRALVTER